MTKDKHAHKLEVSIHVCLSLSCSWRLAIHCGNKNPIKHVLSALIHVTGNKLLKQSFFHTAPALVAPTYFDSRPPPRPPPPKKSTSQRCSSRNMLQCSFLYFVVYIDCIGYLLADTWNPLPITRLTLMVSLICCITCKKQKPQQYIYSAT